MKKGLLSAFFVMLALLSGGAEAQTPPANAEVRSFAFPPLEELQATRQRPLFSPRRRPDARAAAQTDAPVIEEDPGSLPFDLTGIVMGADRAIAILRNRETQETVQLRQGETVEAWSVEAIAQRHVVLRNDDRQVRLELFEQKSDGSAVPAPPSRTPLVFPQRTRAVTSDDAPQVRRAPPPGTSQRRPVRRTPQRPRQAQ